jgi:hypothetical protein
MKIIQTPLTKPQSYRGRNGEGTAIEIETMSMEIGVEKIVSISPITKRGFSNSCIIQISFEDVPAFIKALQDLTK